MKTKLLLSTVVLTSLASSGVMAQYPNQFQGQNQYQDPNQFQGQNQFQNQYQNHNAMGGSQGSQRASSCLRELKAYRALPPGSTPPAIPDNIKECMSLEVASIANEGSLNDDREFRVSRDGRIRCEYRAGYTLDYDSCKSGLNAYHWILDLEQGMFLVQKVRMDQNQNNITNEVIAREAKGEGQDAAFDAMVKDSEMKHQLNQEQAAAYTAAVGTLSGVLYSWTTPNSAVKDKCKNYNPQPGKNSVPCEVAVELTVKNAKREAFANDAAKAALISAASEFVAKGAQAGIAAAMFKRLEKQVDEARPTFADGQIPTLEECAYMPTHPACMGSGSRVSNSSIVAGDFSMGSSDGNSFNNNAGDATTLGDDAALTDMPLGQEVAGVNSPFLDEAMKANSILDPAGAATLQPGGGAGGGGGGGGGAGGGGSASLGDDLQSASGDADKASEIKAKQVSNSYAAGGGTGFQAVRGSKEEANPFSSLFDAQSSAGSAIEEDRSIASADVDGKDSGLFQRISKRFGQVVADKRIEVKNLE